MVLGLFVGAARAADDPEPPAQDTAKLVGDWEVTEFKIKGMAIPFPNDAKMAFVFKKDGTLSSNGGGFGGQQGGKWKINARKSPKHLDLSDGNMTTLMIYKLEKDVLTIAVAEGNGKDRPKDFASADVTIAFKRKAKK